MLISYLKSDLRKHFLAQRKLLTVQELAIKSQQICELFFQNFSINSIQNIHIFLPIKFQKEIDTWLIIRELQEKYPQKNIILPKVNDHGTLTNYLFSETIKLQENKWKILEPILSHTNKPVENTSIDLVIIPLLIFDKKGYRVGYGKGFYDRFLATCRTDVIKIGVSIFEPIEAIKEVNEFDIKLDFCITPSQVWKFI